MSLALKISRSIDNHIWKIIFSLDPSKFSESDRQLIAKFGEPEINVGGTFLGPVSREENKSYVNLGGTSPNGTGAVFSVSRNAAGVVSSVVLGVGIDPGGSGYLVGDTVTVSGQSIGGQTADNLTITITAVSVSSTGADGTITTFTFSGGGSLGPVVNPNEYSLPDKYVRIRSDLPYVQEFESRSGVFATNTKIKAEAFEEAFIEKYTAAVLTLRAMHDTFTGESIVNI